MTTIILTNSDKATEAGYWAIENVVFEEWDLKLESLFQDTQYHFKFKNKKDATMFSLKWL